MKISFVFVLAILCGVTLNSRVRETEAAAIEANDSIGSPKLRELWIKNGERRIFGELSLPEGKPKGVAIVSHGFNGSHQFSRVYFNLMNELGYQCYAFDFPCGSNGSRSDNNTVNMSIPDEQSDLAAIVDYFKLQDPEQKIVLIGESQGGLVSALTAAQLGSTIDRLILVFPALCIPDNWRNNYPKLSDIPEVTEFWGVKLGRRFFEEIHDMNPFDSIGAYRGPVIIIQGDNDHIVSLEDSKHALELYDGARLHVIPGAGHGFNAEQQKESQDQIRKFMN